MCVWPDGKSSHDSATTSESDLLRWKEIEGFSKRDSNMIPTFSKTFLTAVNEWDFWNS